MMSSKDIIFTAGNGLNPGMKAEIAVAWPFLLDGHIRLQLVLQATILSSQDGVAEAAYPGVPFPYRAAGGGFS
jgi:hypothetical protein